MIELLVLFSVNKRAKTAYSIRKDILDIFGNLSEPSFGTLHPAMKRLEKSDFVKSKSEFTKGGRKSTYFDITKTGRNHFKKLFFVELPQNPSTFKSQLDMRLAVISMLNKEDKTLFLESITRQLELMQINIEKSLNDEYTQMDVYQKLLCEKAKQEANLQVQFIEKFKAIK